MASNNQNNQSRGIPPNQSQRQQGNNANNGNPNRRRPRDVQRMADYNERRFSQQFGDSNWSGRTEMEERRDEAFARFPQSGRNANQARNNNNNRTDNSRGGSSRRNRPPPEIKPSTTETPPTEEALYTGNGRGSKPVKKTLGHNFEFAGFIPLVRQVYEVMCTEDQRMPRSLPYAIFQHAMTEFLVAYQLYVARFQLKVPALQRLMDPLAAISAASYNIPQPIFNYICGIGPNIAPTGDKVAWNLPDVAIPLPPMTIANNEVRSGSFGPVTAENHNVYECYVSPYITSELIRKYASTTSASPRDWTPLPGGWHPPNCIPNENLLGYEKVCKLHPDSIRKLQKCIFANDDSVTGLLCHSAYAMDLSSSVLGELKSLKCVLADFKCKENNAAFIFKEAMTGTVDATLWDEPSTLFSPFSFSAAASNRANFMAYKRKRNDIIPGTCYLCNGQVPEGWETTINSNFECTAPFTLQRGYTNRECLRSEDHEEEEGEGTVTQDVYIWLMSGVKN